MIREGAIFGERRRTLEMMFALLGIVGPFVACSRAGGDRSLSSKAQAPVVHLTAKQAPEVAPPSIGAATPASYEGLHNVVAYSEGLYSGGVPENAEAFETLKKMGVTTIVSVDGAQPDVDAAKAHGLSYVHLPIGYNGMDEERTMEIAKAISLSDGPVYVHCHHGKHRSAAAAGAAAVTLGLLTNDEAGAKLKVSGTSPDYPGLYACVAEAHPATVKNFEALPNEFPERWRTTDFVQAMVEIDNVFERLTKIREAGWKVPADHPDLVPAAEAGQLADLFRNLRENEEIKTKPEQFSRWIAETTTKMDGIESGLNGSAVLDGDSLNEAYAAVSKSCKDCHAKFRNPE